jgi:hypothetical protein
MKQHPPVFKLDDIADWPANGFVELPKVQRGFVWKPNQIEDLWDSLMRKYPVGAFVFNVASDGKLQLLDGQQRATAITLGFDHKTFRGSENHIKIFIDLELPQNDARKYYFRVITESHPWGYQRKPNNKPLDSDEKRNASKYFGDFDSINPDLNQCFPYDATLPIPFSFFLDAKNESELFELIFNWSLWSVVKRKLQDNINANPKQLEKRKELVPLNANPEFLKKRIVQIYKDVQLMLQKREIPGLYLENLLAEVLDEIRSSLHENVQDKPDDAEQEHEVENLFVRLNAGGTPLRGEELNYSILKSKIKPELQKQLEDTCEYFIKPARFITVAFRLQQYVGDKSTAREGLNMNIKPRQFQSRLISEAEIERFEEFISKLLTKKVFEKKTLFEYSKQLLEYHPANNLKGFPHLIVNKLINSSPELLFMFWYRLLIKKDRFSLKNPAKKIHEKMLGMYSMFLWLGKGDINRDYSKLLRNIWPAMKVLNTEHFWSSETVRRAMLNEVLLPIPSFKINSVKDIGFQWFLKQPYNLKSAMFYNFEKVNSKTYWNTKELFFNRDLILYAQRKFLNSVFKNKHFYLDDTNVPFDWDHIYPHKLIEKKKNTPRLIKEFYNSIGNFRAWPYELNRMDSAGTPKSKLNPPLSEIKQSNEHGQSWRRFIDKYPELITDINELPKKLLEWSVCQKEWALSDVNNIKTGDAKEVVKLIVKRAINIIDEWYTELHIDSLIPTKSNLNTSDITQALVRSEHKKNPAWMRFNEFKEQWVIGETTNLILDKKVIINNTSLDIYFSFSKNFDEQIREDNILFGFYDRHKTSCLVNLNVPDNYRFDLNKKNHYLQGYFTLVTQQEPSLQQLFEDIAAWINHKQFPLKNQRSEIKRIISDALLKKYKYAFE